MDYDLKYGSADRREKRARRLRLVLVFFLVAAITAFIIWKLVPPQEKQQKKTPAAPAAAAVEKEQQTVRPAAPSGETKDISPAAPSQAAPVQAEAAADPSTTEGQGGLTTEKTSDEPQTKEPDIQEAFEKGKVSPGDLPAELDKPQVPAEKNNAQKELADLDLLLSQKRYADVSRQVEQLLSRLTQGSEDHRKALQLLTTANWERFLAGDSRDGFTIRHTVSPGEYLGRLVRKNKTTLQAVMLANKLKSPRIRIGQKLFFLNGDWKISVSKNTRQLLLFRNGRIFMGFDVGIGRQGRTPTADFVISDRLKNPDYRTRDGRIFKHGEKGTGRLLPQTGRVRFPRTPPCRIWYPRHSG